ncbi:MAG: glycoside hydrolase family 5 protein [Ignavibacteriales bacterium]|nr:glycoside hydrolase family 5 protein [Ignavibacteriales bacterium]
MKSIKITILYLIIFVFLSCNNSDGINDQDNNQNKTVVNKFGQLSIDGSNILDESGNVIVLRGMSLFWSQWAPNYFTEETVKWLIDDWKCTIIRAAMGVENGGYLDNPNTEYEKISTVIDACIKLGIYVVVDWHDHNAEDHLESANDFFDKISKSYGHYPNVIYEIYNEPLDESWNNVLKPYSESVVNVIRKNDPDNLIIVGTPNWSQDVDDVIGNLIDSNNIAYSLHFYTGTHREWLREKANKAILANIPLFISEWGLSEADGNGIIDIAETNLWADFMELKNLSWCNWSVNNKDETSSILLPTTTAISGWNDNELSEAGKIMKDYLVKMNSEIFDSLSE